MFDVDVPDLESKLVSLSQDQTLDGNYLFNTLDVPAAGFRGGIFYNYEGRDQSLYGMCGKLLLSSVSDTQTFTKARSFNHLDATAGVTTGTSGTESVQVGSATFNIKDLYDSGYKLDEDNTINSADFQIQNELTVSSNVEVSGKAETVDVLALASDIVIEADDDLVITSSGGTTFTTVSSNSQPISVPGKKTFTDTLTVTGDIATSGHLVVSADGIERTFTSDDSTTGITNRILRKTGATQTVSTNIELNGNVKIEEDLQANSIDGVDISSISTKYEYTAGDISPPITANTLYATIPTWGRTFGVTFLLWIEAYPLSEQPQPWAELVRFTSTEGNCCSDGDRIPAIFLHKDGYIRICTFLSFYHCENVFVDLQSWTLVELKQDHEGNKVILNLCICIVFHLILFLVVL